MIQVTKDCRGCGICQKNCPNDAILIEEKLAVIGENCSDCGICSRVCPFDAIIKTVAEDEPANSVRCTFCPVQCLIKDGLSGACKRFINTGGALKRNKDLVFDNDKEDYSRTDYKPIITGTGAGSTYPCCRPAPHIVNENRNGVDMVTVVTEAPLSYSGVTVKVDTNTYIGEAGDPIYCGGKKVGMVVTEEYGAKMLSIGGANLLTSKDGFVVARTIVSLANGEEVTISINKKTTMVLKNGEAPTINGVVERKMRVGCGSATVGLFAEKMKSAADEVIVLDHHIIGLLTEHLAGAEVGLTWSGVIVNGDKSTRGRYFGNHGEGIGGTTIMSAIDAVAGVNMTIAKPGMTLLVTDTIGQTRSMFSLNNEGIFEATEITAQALELVETIQATCEESTVSVLYIGGTGGSARGGVTKQPIHLTKAVHEGKVHMTVGGANAYVMPGGGINFMVDTNKVVPDSFTWVPTPATVAPIEYTMTRSDYESIGGHMEAIRDVQELRQTGE